MKTEPSAIMIDLNANARIAAIREKVEAGQRLALDDGVYLYDEVDLFTLGELANIGREGKNGNFAYYNVNTHLNATNVCVYRCTFCAFRADLKGPKGYVMSDEQIVERAAEADRRGATELHIVGGLHHQLPYDWYLNVVRIVHEAHPRLHLKAYTAVEWDWFARLTGRPTRDILAEFKEAGLGSLPGGGAEIFHPEVRDLICEHKADAGAWIRIHREAHQLGLRSEEHTSELQSLRHLVCRLLLEKKNNTPVKNPSLAKSRTWARPRLLNPARPNRSQSALRTGNRHLTGRRSHSRQITATLGRNAT